jgi:hypothetical protein
VVFGVPLVCRRMLSFIFEFHLNVPEDAWLLGRGGVGIIINRQCVGSPGQSAATLSCSKSYCGGPHSR